MFNVQMLRVVKLYVIIDGVMYVGNGVVFEVYFFEFLVFEVVELLVFG